MVSAAGGNNGRALTTAEVTFTASGGPWSLAKTKLLATTADNSGRLIATEPINAGRGIALADSEGYDITEGILPLWDHSHCVGPQPCCNVWRN